MSDIEAKSFELEIFKKYPHILEVLLVDHSTKRNIIWGTNNYKTYGLEYLKEAEIKPQLISGRHHSVIRPRSEKSKNEQKKRSKDMAEVFTPSWICNKQNNLIDNSWFDRTDVFNKELSSNEWVETERIVFNNDKNWKDYVKDTRLEITCGEAPYLVSRYNTVNGEKISINHRIGFLDRKLRVVMENTTSFEEWLEWSVVAIQSIYGFDFQGDNVFLARKNILFDYIDFYNEKFNQFPSLEILEKVSEIVSWNIWQMDGLKFVVPFSCHKEESIQLSFFEQPSKSKQCRGCVNGHVMDHNGIRCIIIDWETNKKIKVLDMFKGGKLW